MRRLSQSKKNRIVDLLFSGMTYREVADIENVSVGVISKTLKEFIGLAEESSIREAAAEYNVEDRVNCLLNLSREARELKVKVPTLLSTVRLVSFMKARGLNASQLEDYLKMCDKHGEDLKNFASKATEFYRLEERAGKPYDKILKEYSTLIKKTTELREEVTELKKKRKHANKDLDRDLTSNDLIRREIPYASALKKALSEYGFFFEDTTKIPRLLREIEACGGNAEVFLERAEEAKDLKWEILNLKDEKKSLEPVVESIRKEGLQIQNEVEDLKKAKLEIMAEISKLKRELKTLNAEAERKSNEIRLAKCLTSILKSKPTDIDAVYNYVYWLKQIVSGAAPELISRKPHYEKTVKTIIVNTLVEYFKEDLASREEVTKLQEKLEEVNERNSILFSENEKLKKANGKLEDANEEFNEKVMQLTEEIRELENRILSDTTIPPRNKKFPF